MMPEKSGNQAPADANLDAASLTPELRAEFDAAARRPLPLRFRYSFIRTYKPVLDDAPYRSPDSLGAVLLGDRTTRRTVAVQETHQFSASVLNGLN